MTSTRAPIDYHADAELRRRIDAESPHWDMMYKALLGQLSHYVQLAVADALEAHGIARPLAAPISAPAAIPRASVPHAAPETGPRASAPSTVPPWLQPFALPDNVRFTRTPDHYLRNDRAAAQHHHAELDEPEEFVPHPEPVAFDPDLPAWRRPFTLPPNVRINRSPERRPADDPGKAEDAQGPEAEPALGRAKTEEAEAETGEATGWFGIIYPDAAPLPRQADEQDNAHLSIDTLEVSHGAASDDLIAAAWAAMPAAPDAPRPEAEPRYDFAMLPEPAPDAWGFSLDHMITALMDHGDAPLPGPGRHCPAPDAAVGPR